MPWARLDERFPGHRKVRRLSDAAFRLHVSAICWSCEYLTDGRISADELDEVSTVRRPQQAVNELVKAGRWHLPGHECPSEHCEPIDEGWLIHDFLDYNPSRSEIEAKRVADAERKRKGRASESRVRPRGHITDSARSPSVPNRPVTEPSSSVAEQPPRADVEHICRRLATRMVENGCKQPTITDRWRDAARLLLDKDGRDLNEVLAVIEWSQSDSFWKGNIQSLPTLREQFDKLRLRMKSPGTAEPAARTDVDRKYG